MFYQLTQNVHVFLFNLKQNTITLSICGTFIVNLSSYTEYESLSRFVPYFIATSILLPYQ